MNKTILGSIIILIIIGLSGSYYLHFNQKENAYFVVATVYNSFDFKKELEVNFENIKAKKEARLDSLEVAYSARIESIDQNEKNKLAELAYLKKQYQKLSEKISKENSYLQQDYEAKIWERLNKYVEQYGKDNQCEFIYGASGNGVIFYADDNLNITESLIEYVNKQHNDE